MLKQFAKPDKGDIVALMHTTMGDISILLFKDDAPKTVENFVTHAKNGYYNGIIFHRVIKDFMIQGGDPTGTGCGGESIWGEPFEDEFSSQLHNYRGALCMANAGPSTNGSQFFIVQASDCAESLIEQMKQYPDMYPNECVAAYEAMGGTPWLDYHHSVFGQVIKGMDVVDAIASAPTAMGDKPVEDISIISIDIEVKE